MQLLTNQSCRCHSGNGCLALIMINTFRIFTQSHFNGKRRFDNHAVDTVSIRFDSCQLTGNGIGGTRACYNSSNAAFQRLSKAIFHWINGINGTQMRCNRFSIFVAVVALKIQTIFKNAQMCMCINKSRIDVRSL